MVNLDDPYHRICTELNKVCQYYLGKPTERSWKKDIYFKCPQCEGNRFSANEERKVAHCFKCSFSCNAIQLIQFKENLTVKEAINKGISILGLPFELSFPEVKYTRVTIPDEKEQLFVPMKHSIYLHTYHFYSKNNKTGSDYYKKQLFPVGWIDTELIDLIVSKPSLDLVTELLKYYPESTIEACPGFVRNDQGLQFVLNNHILFPYWEPYQRYIASFNGRVKRLPKDGRKYKWTIGERKHLYFPRGVTLNNVTHITEGEKKAIVATQAGYNTIGVSGVDCFDVEEIANYDFMDREISICYDRDSINNNVTRAENRLSEFLKTRNARPKVINLPAGYKLDDYLFEFGKEALNIL